jgi:hypothetical protein
MVGLGEISADHDDVFAVGELARQLEDRLHERQDQLEELLRAGRDTDTLIG